MDEQYWYKMRKKKFGAKISKNINPLIDHQNNNLDKFFKVLPKKNKDIVIEIEN